MKKIFIIFVFFLFSFQLFAEEEKMKIAVMEFEDKNARIPEEILTAATEYLRSAFSSTNKYVVISQSRQKEKVAEIRKEYNTNQTYKSCTDRTCQIQLGQALSADLIVQTIITRFASIYTISSELTDLESEATEIGAKADFDGTEESMKEALDSIVEQITETYQKNAAEREAKLEKEKQKLEEENRKLEEEKRRLEEEKRMEAAEQKRLAEEEKRKEEANKVAAKKKKEINIYKYTGISFIVAGAAILGGGIGGFTADYKKERDNYNKMISSEFIKGYASSGMSKEDYIKKANSYRKKANTSRNMIFASGAVGAAFAATGAVLVYVAVKKEKENKQISLNNMSVMPTENGFYASLGFDF